MLNISGHEGNANQNHDKFPPHLMVEWLTSITQTTTKVGEDVGKKEPSYTVGGNVN
jgi:hypothetical protein